MSDIPLESDTVVPKNDARKIEADTNGHVAPDNEPGTTPADPLYDLVDVAPATASAGSSAEPPAVGPDQSAPVTVAHPLTEREPSFAQGVPIIQQTIYVPAPSMPAPKGNRSAGILIALGSTIVFAGLFSLALALILSLNNAGLRFDFLGSVTFYIPVILFFIGFVILVVIANRANWWAHVLGSLFVALFVYFGTIATGLVLSNIVAETPAGAARLFALAVSNPFVIAAAILAREVSMWMGATISTRGRRVKAKNADAKADFDRETAERHAQYEQARYRAPDSVG